jgi:nitroreductase
MYGVIRGAPAYLVGAVSSSERAMEDFGYRMEGIILEATGIGLGTCWMGGMFNRSSAARLLPLGPGEIIPAVTPIGHPSEKPSLIDGVFRFVARSSTRLPFEQLFYRESFDKPLAPEDASEWRDVLECVRRGPSASNRQPWRIVLERRPEAARLHLFFAEDRMYNSRLEPVRLQNIDLGIAMRHVAEAAAALGIAGAWERLPDAPVASELAYVASWS